MKTKQVQTIKILGVNYSINEVDFIADGSAMGRSSSKTGQIFISKDMPEDIQRATLLHEILHQISDRGGVNLSEEQVRILECGLVPFFHGV